jgi:tetratricopeptide (TPR) repeat protein
LEVARRLQRFDIVAAEAEALLSESATGLTPQEKAEMEMAMAIGHERKGRIEAALAIWRRLVSTGTPLNVEGRAWAWRNISLALPLSDPEAKEAAQRSADAFLQAGNKHEAGTSLLRVADCLMTVAPEQALQALDQMFSLVEQESIGNRQLRAAVYHARANRLLTLRNAALALEDAKQAIVLCRGIFGAEAQLISSLRLAAAALMILGNGDEAKAHLDEADVLTRQGGVGHFELANQVMSLFKSFNRNLADRLENDARAAGSWEIVSGVVVARATHDPMLSDEERLSKLEGLLLELQSANAPDEMKEPARRAIASRLTKMNNPDRAFGWWRDLARDRPWDDDIFANFYNCCMALKNWSDAEKVVRSRIALRGELPGFLFFLGKVLYSDGRMQEAATALHKASRMVDEDSDIKRIILELRDRAMDAGGTILSEKQPEPPKEISRSELEAVLEDFSLHIKANQRMSFWRTKKGKRDWVEGPEKLAKDQLHTSLQIKFGNRIGIFTEIAAGAGRLDIYLELSGGLSVIIELKMCGGRYPSSYAAAGEDQILHYMENRDTRLGYLVVFDARVGKFRESVLSHRNVDNYTVYEKFVDVRPDRTALPKASIAKLKR